MVSPVFVILDNIRSVHNVGSIFRTCDAAGVEKLYLCGTTPTPVDRFGRERKDLAKVSLGAEKTVTWEYCAGTKDAIAKCKEEGATVIAVEQTNTAIDYKKFTSAEPTAFVFGNEIEGISKEVLAMCDAAVEIPMRGAKESLNVAVTVGVILFNQ
jgi:23S rRNA (guanosine2251-2'-O)-methyltransferase